MLALLVAKMSDKRKLVTPVRVTPYTYIHSDKLFTSLEVTNYQKATIEAFKLLSWMKITHSENLISHKDICLMLAIKYDLNCSGCKSGDCPRFLEVWR